MTFGETQAKQHNDANQEPEIKEEDGILRIQAGNRLYLFNAKAFRNLKNFNHNPSYLWTTD